MTLKQTYDQEQIHSRWESVYRGHPILRDLDDRMMDRIIANLNLPSYALFLDAGCGGGEHSFRIAARGYRCVGVDLSEARVGLAKKRAVLEGLTSRVSFTCQALEDLAFQDHTFDAIHCRGVLMHIPAWKKALANLCRVLKPEGHIAILENNHKSLEMRLVLLVRKIQRRHSKMLRTEAGFEFWSEENGQPFVVRVADLRYLSSELQRNGIRPSKRFAHELFDLNRFPAGILRNSIMQLNKCYFLFSLPHSWCIGNAIIGQKAR